MGSNENKVNLPVMLESGTGILGHEVDNRGISLPTEFHLALFQ